MAMRKETKKAELYAEDGKNGQVSKTMVVERVGDELHITVSDLTKGPDPVSVSIVVPYVQLVDDLLQFD